MIPAPNFNKKKEKKFLMTKLCKLFVNFLLKLCGQMMLTAVLGDMKLEVWVIF